MVVDDITREFLAECDELLDQLDEGLVQLEARPRDPEVIAGLFRALHTIKGSCGFLGFSAFEGLTHAGESLLACVRAGSLTLDAAGSQALYELAEASRALLTAIRERGVDDLDVAELTERLVELREPAETAPAPDASPTTPVAPLGERLVMSGVVGTAAVSEALRKQADGDPRKLGEILVANGHARPSEVARTLTGQAEERGGQAPPTDSSVRIDVALLDALMNLVGELVLARNEIQQLTATACSAELVRAAQRLGGITTELQEAVMKTRMQPVSSVWHKLPRLVRHLAMSCAKDVRVELEGRSTELDRAVIEAIRDPLVHVVRNVVDHAIEPPDVRERLGKPRQGRLRLRAHHEGGEVILAIEDDGAGIDPDVVRRRALERGLISAADGARMTARELQALIFAPGFSTRDSVSAISGRGVGMDVVRTNVERVGGTVALHSEVGQGTRLELRIPLTLAIVATLLVRCAGERFALPQAAVEELVRVPAGGGGRGVERLDDAPVLRLRGALLPLVDLRAQLELDAGEPTAARDELHVVVAQCDGRRFGIVVDEVIDTAEIVVKPLGKLLKSIPVFAGATILGDGGVALIIDVAGLAERAGFASQGSRERDRAEARTDAASVIAERTLVFGLGPARRFGIPTAAIDRLEEIDAARIEVACGHPVVQYRDGLLPMLDLRHALAVSAVEHATGPLQVLVYDDGEHRVGLIVDRIVDVVDEPPALQGGAQAPGLRGSAILQGRVTDLVDVPTLLLRAGVPARAQATALFAATALAPAPAA